MGQSKQKNKSTALLFIEYIKIRAHSKREQGKLSTAELYEVAGRHFERFLGKSVCRIKVCGGDTDRRFPLFLAETGVKDQLGQ